MTGLLKFPALGLMVLTAGCGIKDLDPRGVNRPDDKSDDTSALDDTSGPEDTSSPTDTADTADTADTGDTGDTADVPEVDLDGDGVTLEGGDCDDNDASRFPGNPEHCNGVDNDCDGEVDGPNPIDGTLWYADLDRDSWGDEDAPLVACTMPESHSRFPGDCEDSNAAVYPGAIEVCDGLDNDCDHITDIGAVDGDTYYRDADGDGFGTSTTTVVACSTPSGYVSDATDCLDSSFWVNPDATEICNGIDDDCNGAIDETFESLPWFRDADGDGRGNPLIAITACFPPSGYVTDSNDCDDTDPEIHGDMFELCDEKDNDCDGIVDEELSDLVFYRDLDGDGYGTGLDMIIACAPVDGYVSEGTDCNDSDDDIRPGRTEDCNGIDDNCDGTIDEGWPVYDFYPDLDGDGFGAGDAVGACEQPAGHVADATDCDDTDAMVNPSIYADCEDGRDEDCDGEIDEGPDSTFYRDADGDGFGDADDTMSACAPPDGWVWDDTDCDDTSDAVHPDHREDCHDVIDNDCDGFGDDEDPDCDCPDHGYVEDEDLGTATGDAVASGSTAFDDDSYTYGECGSSGAKDRFYRFEAPEDGCYTFDTNTSSYDTLLRILDACEGDSLACDDDGGDSYYSLITLGMEDGQEVFVVVDGYSSSSWGDYVLNINYAAAGELSYDTDLGDDVGDSIATGSNTGEPNDYEGSCGFGGGADLAFLWEAPDSGCYNFNTMGSSYDTVLLLLDADGAGCGTSSELACNDDGGGGLTSMIEYTVTAGTRYVVVVDGFSDTSVGTYTLSINEC
jgi:hypothetical protein